MGCGNNPRGSRRRDAAEKMLRFRVNGPCQKVSPWSGFLLLHVLSTYSTLFINYSRRSSSPSTLSTIKSTETTIIVIKITFLLLFHPQEVTKVNNKAEWQGNVLPKGFVRVHRSQHLVLHLSCSLTRPQMNEWVSDWRTGLMISFECITNIRLASNQEQRRGWDEQMGSAVSTLDAIITPACLQINVRVLLLICWGRGLRWVGFRWLK